MAARHDPGFVGNAWRIRTECCVVPTEFDDAKGLTFLLRQNVAENAAFLALIIIARCAEFIEHAARHERGRRELGGGMYDLRARRIAVILKNADILQAAVAFQILQSLRNQAQELLDLRLARIPQVTVMPWIF